MKIRAEISDTEKRKTTEKAIETKSWFFKKSSKYLIPNTKGGMTHYRRFKDDKYFPLLEKLGVKRRTPHCTRHTFASGLQAKDTKPEDIIRLMGHTDYKTTSENYIHQQLEQLKNSIENLDL